MIETGTKERRKPGPLPGPKMQQASVLLPPELLQWGKEQPGGLSETIRRLMADAQKKQEGEQDTK